MILRKFKLLVICVVGLAGSVAAEPPSVVMLIAEGEYQTARTLPQFAAEQLADDYRVSFVRASPDDPNRLIGVELIEKADVILVSVRRRPLPKDQLDRIRAYVAAGKPVIGIRTASHAFSLRNKPAPQGLSDWPEFDREVFGGNYTNHHGNELKPTIGKPQGLVVDAGHKVFEPILADFNRFVSSGSLYKTSPLTKGTEVLLVGQLEGVPVEPVAWTFTRKDDGKSFYTSLGHVDDFKGDALPALLRLAIDWSIE